MNPRRGKSVTLRSLGALLAIASIHAAPMAVNDSRGERAWVDELQPGRNRTRSSGEAQWKREQRRGKASKR